MNMITLTKFHQSAATKHSSEEKLPNALDDNFKSSKSSQVTDSKITFITDFCASLFKIYSGDFITIYIHLFFPIYHHHRQSAFDNLDLQTCSI
ncbi:hypothetical protein BpHYR1_004835 [Brachionus plicatilis]|uniref:Uncharacterized protein n=1 Tax=Brachionus plicatilis TaxID=10195 RepID=A0A3M7QLW6_BRAPC|nr:hypothetical protein BpHYR1_004835 [Brachionus plicatilis]